MSAPTLDQDVVIDLSWLLEEEPPCVVEACDRPARWRVSVSHRVDGLLCFTGLLCEPHAADDRGKVQGLVLSCEEHQRVVTIRFARL